MKAFDPDIVSVLQEDANVIKYGYRNCSTSSKEIQAYSLIVDGEVSCKMKHHPLCTTMIEDCQNGPWMNIVQKIFPAPHLLTMEVQMNGSVSNGEWHCDSNDFRIMTVVVPLNDTYNRERGGCTQILHDDNTGESIECSANEFRVFDGNCLHRRTGASSQQWASARRMVFLHFADSKRPWYSLSRARVTHCRMKRTADTNYIRQSKRIKDNMKGVQKSSID